MRNKSMMVAASAAAALAFGIGASSASAVSLSPLGQSFTATSTDSQFAAGSVTLSCANSGTSGTTSSTPSASVAITPPTFTTCTSSLGTFNVTSSGVWNLSASSTTAGSLVIPQNGVKITYLSGLCTINVSPAGSTTINGGWDNATSTLTISGQSVPIQVVGFCPGVSSPGAFSATYSVSNGIQVIP